MSGEQQELISRPDMEEIREQSKRNVEEAVRLYNKFRRKALAASVASILMSIAYIVLSLRDSPPVGLLLMSSVSLSCALVDRRGYRTIEKDPILGYLVHLNRFFSRRRPMTPEEQQREGMHFQQFQEPGFEPAVGT